MVKKKTSSMNLKTLTDIVFSNTCERTSIFESILFSPVVPQNMKEDTKFRKSISERKLL